MTRMRAALFCLRLSAVFDLFARSSARAEAQKQKKCRGAPGLSRRNQQGPFAGRARYGLTPACSNHFSASTALGFEYYRRFLVYRPVRRMKPDAIGAFVDEVIDIHECFRLTVDDRTPERLLEPAFLWA